MFSLLQSSLRSFSFHHLLSIHFRGNIKWCSVSSSTLHLLYCLQVQTVLLLKNKAQRELREYTVYKEL